MSMTTDRSLATLLRALQIVSDDQDVSRLWASATTLLTLLTNPLNVTLLSSQLLSAPAIWYRPNGLRTSIGILSIFNSATVRVLSSQGSAQVSYDSQSGCGLNREEWITAIIKGADDRSSRWQHLLALGGLLLGLATPDGERLSLSVKHTIEGAIVKAVNLALRDSASDNPLAVKTLAVVLSHVFDLLGENHKHELDHDLLLPRLCHSAFFDIEGLHSGYFLGTMDADVIQATSSKFDWSTKSATYTRVQRVASGPLFESLGSMSRLIAFSAENVENLDLLAVMIQDISAFARCLCVQWRQNKLSEIDITEETTFLSDETLRTSLPLLWRVLKSSMFASIVILRSVLGRALRDSKLPMDMHPYIAIQTLHILRNLYFISSRLGANVFSQYTFVSLTAIDLLSQHPVQAEAFIREIRPAEIGSIPQHPLDRCHDLYFLNLSEHFPFLLSEKTNEDLLVKAATPYLGLGGDQRLLEIFEAAHSVMLAVFAVPHNTDLTVRNIHTYFDALFKVFPQNLSARQFRIAFKTLIRIAAPPNPISELQPLLPSTLLDLVHFRLQSASSEPLHSLAPSNTPSSEIGEQPALSEQSVLLLALIDALPFLPIMDLEDWLPVVAGSLDSIQSEPMLHTCRQRFWEVLSSGEMDVERAAVCVAWWTTGGGRDIVLFGADQAAGPFMSGALTEVSKL